jgi:hypothetical protein
MDKKIAGLLGAAAALVSMSSANAASPAAGTSLQATSYADLLNPVPNAVAQLIADDAARAAGEVKTAQIQVEIGHHHHHRYHRRHRRHHHHHHHHHSNFMAIPRADV